MKAVSSGAYDYIEKPIHVELLRLRISAAISRAENERLRAENRYLAMRLQEDDT